MYVCNNPNIFQEKISELFEGFNTVREYIDNLLVIAKKYFTDHLKELEKYLQWLTEALWKIKAEKSFFKQTETEYLSFWVSNQGMRPHFVKIQHN